MPGKYGQAGYNSYCLPNLENLPDLVMTKIFSYLDLNDLCKIGGVNRRWYHLSRSKSLWKQIDVKIANYDSAKKNFPPLPSFVMHLKMGKADEICLMPLSLPQIMEKLASTCPFLTSLKIDRAILLYYAETNVNISIKDPRNGQAYLELSEEDNYLCTDIPQNILKDEIQKYPFMNHLKVLSIRRSLFDSSHFFSNIEDSALPNLEILDFTNSSCVFPTILILMDKFSNLQELYLGSTGIQVEVLQKMKRCLKRIKVFDLEGLYIESTELLLILRENQCLEKLYLGYSELIDDTFLRLLKQDLFPNLNVLCLRNTRVSSRAVTYFRKSWGVTKSLVINHSHRQQFLDNYCDHFLQNHPRYK